MAVAHLPLSGLPLPPLDFKNEILNEPLDASSSSSSSFPHEGFVIK